MDAAKLIAILFTLASFSTTSLADTQTNSPEEETRRLKLLLGAGLTHGGDDLLKLEFEDGSSEKLYAGGLIDLKAGFSYKLHESPIRIHSTVGYFWDSVNAENADGSFDRIPLEVLGFYTWNEHQLGVGASYHTNVQLDFEGLGEDFKADFDDSLGAVIEYGYAMNDKLTFAVRGVFIDYSLKNAPSDVEDIDGNHIGVFAYLTL